MQRNFKTTFITLASTLGLTLSSAALAEAPKALQKMGAAAADLKDETAETEKEVKAKLQAEASKTKKAASPTPKTSKQKITMRPDGLVIQDVVVGTGKEAKKGSKVVVDYTGKLNDANGKTFDSSIGREPFEFNLGAGQVIKGWDEGVAGMRVGGERNLTIPAKMAYGDRDMGVIPPNSTLFFNVKMKDVK